jgi:hypothetical protein
VRAVRAEDLATSRPRGRGAAIVATALFIALLTSSVFVAVTRPTQSFYPRQWDARVAGIAESVARLRGLSFRHPVPVRFLPPSEFERRAAADIEGLDDEARSEVERSEKVLRAVGLLGGDVDLLESVTTARRSATLAQYSFADKEILVRGTELDASHRVTIAHELTHVLQDQHFDLSRLTERADESRTGDASAFNALVEGDAVRIERAFLEGLPAAAQRAYEAQQAAEGERIEDETGDVPDVVKLVFGAPYEFGPATLEVLDATGGNGAVDRAITGPVPGSRLYLEPAALESPPEIEPPRPPAGARRLGEAESFGPFELYLMLGMRLDALRALEAADALLGGRAITYERDGVACYRVALSFRRASSAEFVRRALEDWARPPARAAARRTVEGAGTGFTACDPGAGTPPPSQSRFESVLRLLATRIGFTVGAVQNQVEPDLARCAARVFVTQPGIARLVDTLTDAEPSAAQQEQIESAAFASRTRCVDDLDAGLR